MRLQVFSTRTDKPHQYGFYRPTEELTRLLPYEPIEFAISPDGINWVSCYDVPDLVGIHLYQAPDVAPAVQTDNLRKVGLNDGQSLVSSSYEPRELKMLVSANGDPDEPSTLLGYDALQRFLVSRSAYWICFANWPQRMYYVKAKLGAPVFAGPRQWTCEVTLTDLNGLSRSVGTTTTNDRVYGFGNNEPSAAHGYHYTTNTFTVQNLSDVLIDPERRGHPLKITLKGSSNGGLSITNKTTGDRITRSDGFSGTWILDGVNPMLNGKGDLANTNAGVITLQIGANDFQVSGFSGTVDVDFALWWLS